MLAHDARGMNNSVHPVDVAEAKQHLYLTAVIPEKTVSLKFIVTATAISEDNQDEICLAEYNVT